MKTRRRFLYGITGFLGGLLVHRPAVAATPTPRAAEGPFYPDPSMRHGDIDNDLVKVTGLVQRAGGEVIRLKGRVLDADGAPRAGYRVEIWQCDMNGKYMHPGDRQPMAHDAGFQGFGHDISKANGSYEFRTIKPTSYPGRTPHIHVKIVHDGAEVLTTQFYLDGHSDNRRDGLFQRMSKAQADAVSMTFAPGQSEPEAIVDIVV